MPEPPQSPPQPHPDAAPAGKGNLALKPHFYRYSRVTSMNSFFQELAKKVFEPWSLFTGYTVNFRGWVFLPLVFLALMHQAEHKSRILDWPTLFYWLYPYKAIKDSMRDSTRGKQTSSLKYTVQDETNKLIYYFRPVCKTKDKLTVNPQLTETFRTSVKFKQVTWGRRTLRKSRTTTSTKRLAGKLTCIRCAEAYRYRYRSNPFWYRGRFVW